MLGPWAVSGPALAVGAAALADTAWIEATRHRLWRRPRRLDGILIGAGLGIPGGTALFRLVRTPVAPALFQHLGRAGILVRNFPDNAAWLRFGLPPARKSGNACKLRWMPSHNGREQSEYKIYYIGS